MRIFRCDHCGQPVFFENVQCLHCGSALAFLPDRLFMAAIEPIAQAAPQADAQADPQTPAPALWQRRSRRPAGQGTPRAYRLCHNHGAQKACNFAVPASDPHPLCVSCRQTRLLPDLSLAANHERWCRIEIAKRRLFYTLARLGLTPSDPPPDQAPAGPVYEFLADQPGLPPVMTGHRNGVITLNVAEADDDERARRRVALHEPYRTLLGHLRHESCHYYWDALIAGQPERLAAFRTLFGDDSQDYGQALARHYANGPPEWQASHVSAYATAHPWEDWAETWAHYLHMVDLLETASAYSTRVVVPGDSPDEAEEVGNPFAGPADFDQLVSQWVPVTLLLNSLNRSLGQNDAYPFALTPGALGKLRFVHDVIQGAAAP